LPSAYVQAFDMSNKAGCEICLHSVPKHDVDIVSLIVDLE
jgi:hypothetical protein